MAAPLKYGTVDYRFSFFSTSATGSHYYACMFRKRLPLIASSTLLNTTLREPLGDYVHNPIPGRIAAFLVRNGADIARDACREIVYER